MLNRLHPPAQGYLSARVSSFQRPFLQILVVRKMILLCCLLFAAQWLTAQESSVQGKIMAGDTALPGISVQVKGTRTATQTDNNGNFSIKAGPDATLIITGIGYTAQEIRVGNRKNINIQLESSAKQLDQVVVIGYGTQKKNLHDY